LSQYAIEPVSGYNPKDVKIELNLNGGKRASRLEYLTDLEMTFHGNQLWA